MNERIKELSERATIKTSYQYHTWGDRIATKTKEVFDREKFAELIVQECAELVDGRTFLYAGNTIREHFGIEE
jgi:hypothetical protein